MLKNLEAKIRKDKYVVFASKTMTDFSKLVNVTKCCQKQISTKMITAMQQKEKKNSKISLT
jgi:hypothetical protein